jgi:vacuolar protein-sorting-associated protein 4
MIAARTEGYSGSDIQMVVREALMLPVRAVQQATYWKYVAGRPRAGGAIAYDCLTPTSPGDPDGIEMSWSDVPPDKLKEPIVNMPHMLKALRNTKPSVSQDDLARYEKFTADFGSEG